MVRDVINWLYMTLAWTAWVCDGWTWIVMSVMIWLYIACYEKGNDMKMCDNGMCYIKGKMHVMTENVWELYCINDVFNCIGS